MSDQPKLSARLAKHFTALLVFHRLSEEQGTEVSHRSEALLQEVAKLESQLAEDRDLNAAREATVLVCDCWFGQGIIAWEKQICFRKECEKCHGTGVVVSDKAAKELLAHVAQAKRIVARLCVAAARRGYTGTNPGEFVEDFIANWMDKAEEDSALLHEVLEKIVNYVSVCYPFPPKSEGSLMQLELNGHPVYRPVEKPNRDELGTLFTFLLNAKKALENIRSAARAGKEWTE